MSECQPVGIDVSAKSLTVQVGEGARGCLEFSNSVSGHRALIGRLTKRGRKVRVCLEATGNYSLDVALALHGARGVEVMVVNPRAAKRFSEALIQRSKTDKVDASLLREFALRMPFTPWQPPSSARLELRSMCRRIGALKCTVVQEKNRLHAATATATVSATVRNDIEVNLRHLERRIARMQEQALRLIQEDEALHQAFQHILSIKGFAAHSTTQLLGELGVLSPEMTPKQWVAHAGLAPHPVDSGDSVHRPARICKAGNVRLRRPLYMPALVAIQHEPTVRAFYEQLLSRGKKPMQANVAVMRKLLHAIHGMLRHDEDFDGQRFYRTANTPLAKIA